MSEVYDRLAHHLSKMYAGWWTPTLEELKHILEVNFTPEEAEVLLALPNDRLPLETAGLDEVASKVAASRQRLSKLLERLVSRGLVFAGKKREAGAWLCPPTKWLWLQSNMVHVKLKGFLNRLRGEEKRYAACGRLVIERPVEVEVGGVKYYFCCEHCAAAFTPTSE